MRLAGGQIIVSAVMSSRRTRPVRHYGIRPDMRFVSSTLKESIVF